MFDLGLRKELESYLPPQQVHLDNRIPYRLGPGVASKLEDYECAYSVLCSPAGTVIYSLKYTSDRFYQWTLETLTL